MEADQDRRKPVAGDRLAGLDIQGAPLQSAEFRQGELRRLRMGEGRPCFSEEDASRLGRLDPAAHAVEERNAIAVLEGTHRRAYRGWRQVERRSGLGQMLSFRDGDEDA